MTLERPVETELETAREILGVSEGTTLQELHDAKKRELKKHHPDVGGDVARAKQISNAFKELEKLTSQHRADVSRERKDGPPLEQIALLKQDIDAKIAELRSQDLEGFVAWSWGGEKKETRVSAYLNEFLNIRDYLVRTEGNIDQVNFDIFERFLKEQVTFFGKSELKRRFRRLIGINTRFEG